MACTASSKRRRPAIRAAAFLVVLVLMTGCDPSAGNDPDNPEGLSGTCGLPTPEPDRKESVVPVELLPQGAEITRAQKERGGFTTAINVRLSVAGALAFYTEAVEAAGYETIQVDDEGFEAEMYLRKGKRLAAIQIRMSTCDDRSIVFVNEVVPEQP